MSQDERLSIEITENAGIPIIHVGGEIDLYTVSRFDRALQEAIGRATRAVVVDLTDLSYIDSAGLSTLLNAHRSLSERNAVLYVVAPPGRPGVCRVLEITRLDRVVKRRSTVDEAIRELTLSAAA
jgi:anti-sigma B factor antagonist